MEYYEYGLHASIGWHSLVGLECNMNIINFQDELLALVVQRQAYKCQYSLECFRILFGFLLIWHHVGFKIRIMLLYWFFWICYHKHRDCSKKYGLIFNDFLSKIEFKKKLVYLFNFFWKVFLKDVNCFLKSEFKKTLLNDLNYFLTSQKNFLEDLNYFWN